MNKAPDLSVFPIPRKGGARPITEIEAAPNPAPRPSPAPVRGTVIATTVKLDENRYLRLMQAGAPRPGQMRRRTIQDMLVEALDAWLERHDL
jgi:hypothetical protein